MHIPDFEWGNNVCISSIRCLALRKFKEDIHGTCRYQEFVTIQNELKVKAIITSLLIYPEKSEIHMKQVYGSQRRYLGRLEIHLIQP